MHPSICNHTHIRATQIKSGKSGAINGGKSGAINGMSVRLGLSGSNMNGNSAMTTCVSSLPSRDQKVSVIGSTTSGGIAIDGDRVEMTILKAESEFDALVANRIPEPSLICASRPSCRLDRPGPLLCNYMQDCLSVDTLPSPAPARLVPRVHLHLQQKNMCWCIMRVHESIRPSYQTGLDRTDLLACFCICSDCSCVCQL